MRMRHALALCLLALPVHVAADDSDDPLPSASIRDYYEEPGLNPHRDTRNDSFNEQIDPFSGSLQLSFTDLVIPGNGGFDIEIKRTYTHVQGSLPPYSPYGTGWTMHFGRIVVGNLHSSKVCVQQQYAISVKDNPMLELPSGERHLLVLAVPELEDLYLVTKSMWRADCNSTGEVITVVSRDGMRYRMDFRKSVVDETHFYPTRIEDPNGNWMEIAYSQTTSGYIIIDELQTSDGRVVTYSYTDEDEDTVRLASISAHGQTWTYDYTQISETLVPYQQLTSVIRPDGTSWEFDYYGLITDGSAGSFALQRMTYPWGGEVSYGYDDVQFEAGNPDSITTVVSQKEQSGRDVPTDQWSYAYVPAYASSSAYDETTVEGPYETRIYYHYGYNSVSAGSVWRIGLRDFEQVLDENGVLIEQIENTWTGFQISNENYWHGRDTQKIDPHTLAPLLVQSSHFRNDDDGWVGVTTSYDDYLSSLVPQTVTETGTLVEYPERTTLYTYESNTQTWMLDLVTSETVIGPNEDAWTINRSFDNAGNMISESVYGVETTYTFTADGDVATQTDANNNTTTFSNYFRGVAQSEQHPEGITISRTVNPTGTIASETDGRGNTRTFTWDGLNRLTGITYPVGAPVSINYGPTGKTLTRGSLSETQEWDGLRRVVTETTQDISTSDSVEITRTFDARNRVTFESYPNSSSGTTYAFDVFDRLTQVTHADGSFRVYQYPLAYERVEIDENLQQTYFLQAIYGSFDEQPLIHYIESPEGIATIIDRDAVGRPVSVFQGQQGGTGLTRSYDYDSRGFLVEEFHPETGDTVLGYDAVGNLTSRQIGSNGVVESFSYDGRDRPVEMSYSDATPTTSKAYDANDNLVTLMHGDVARDYTYDAADNLVEETLQVDGRAYTVAYLIDNLDHIAAITYPSGRMVDFAPNALGRETQALPYVTAAAHHPTGLVSQLTLANGAQATTTLDNRQRLSSIQATAPGGVAADLGYQYDNGLNVTGITDGLDSQRNRAMAYDGVNRLTSAQGVWGSDSIAYDHRGNITLRQINGDTQEYMYSNNRLAIRTFPDTFHAFNYDARGNATADGQALYAYDGAGNLVSADTGAQVISYLYDGAGLLVRSTRAGQSTDRVYADSGLLLGEYDLGGGFREYVHIGTQPVTRIEDATTEVGLAD
ncbi:YD repeat-containing protein [Natronocella acetinitrilica]|uniref:YD repeat-containing protein n=2 Tax=Natronocella acetinitrilica TaxID=414046 RepID=A0AAE3G1D8_9GAMM|nr:YD repeat-containing protein [Natronocella acetinitrilica]